MTTEAYYPYYKQYLQDLADLDRHWKVPRRVDRWVPFAIIATTLLVVMLSEKNNWWLLALPAVFAVPIALIVREVRLTRRYITRASWYFSGMLPGINIERVKMVRRTEAVYRDGLITYHCDLRELARTNGEGGWSVTAKASGNLRQLQDWVASRP